jgi:hypothetical protein
MIFMAGGSNGPPAMTRPFDESKKRVSLKFFASFPLMNTQSLLIVTALVEVGAGIALLLTPSLAVELLLGAGLSSPQSLVAGRVTGAALFALGVTCWLARNGDRDGVPIALVAGMLIYNVAVPILLIYAAIASMMHGIALWPASVLHMVLAVCCIACLRSR